MASEPPDMIVCQEIVILVTGDRNWPEMYDRPIYRELSRFLLARPYVRVVQGGARGVDAIAARTAKILGFRVTEYPAEWDRYGRAAGPIRNAQMLHEEPRIVLCLAFHPNLDTSKGTRDMVMKARNQGIHTEVHGV